MGNFRPTNWDQPSVLPASLDDWLPEVHLARYVVDVVKELDRSGALTDLVQAYGRRGSKSYHPAVLLALLIYGYATGVFSSRAIERATYDSLAFRFISADQHPDHDTIANFRKRFITQLEPLFRKVLAIAKENGFLKLGTVALDGSKIHANASKHSALSYEHAQKIEQQLQQEVQQLMLLAEQADNTQVPDGMDIPEELGRRETRLSAIAEAKAEIERRAKERFEREQAEYEAKMAAREAKEKETGKKPGGKPPEPPSSTPLPKDQVNLTDEESRIMKVPGGSFEQCFNAQAAVATESMLVVATDVTQASNDKQQMLPMMEKCADLPQELGKVERGLADSGYMSAQNVEGTENIGIEPMIATGREPHNKALMERFAPAPEAPPADATATQKMAHRLKTPEGKKAYGLRKQTVEPVFGIIKSVMKFRQFLLRGLENVRGEWELVTMAWNVKRLFALRNA
jgi:transposase